MVTIPSVDMQSIGENITYRCNNGYEIVGTTKTELISQCLENTTWSKDPPHCESNATESLVHIHVLYALIRIDVEKGYITLFKLVLIQV